VYYLNGKSHREDGPARQWWFENGQKMWIHNMKEGKKHGERKEWNEEGELIYHEIYNEGELIEKIL
jgi:antitoxin component YwqK of YwqJK toxin-antitoxin module